MTTPESRLKELRMARKWWKPGTADTLRELVSNGRLVEAISEDGSIFTGLLDVIANLESSIADSVRERDEARAELRIVAKDRDNKYKIMTTQAERLSSRREVYEKERAVVEAAKEWEKYAGSDGAYSDNLDNAVRVLLEAQNKQKEGCKI